jgi:hypothetical protein
MAREREDRFVDAVEMRRALQEVVLPDMPIFTVICDIESGVNADSDAATWCSDSSERASLRGSPSLQDLSPAEVGQNSTLEEEQPPRRARRWWIAAVIVVVVFGGLAGIIAGSASYGLWDEEQRRSTGGHTTPIDAGGGDATPDAGAASSAQVVPITYDAAPDASAQPERDVDGDLDVSRASQASPSRRQKRIRRSKRQSPTQQEKGAPRAFRDPGF